VDTPSSFQNLYYETRFDELQKALNNANVLKPQDNYIKAMLLKARGDFTGSLEILEKIVPDESMHPNYHIGDIYYFLSDYEKAHQHFDRYLRLKQDDSVSRKNIAEHRSAISSKLKHLDSISFPSLEKPSLIPLTERYLSDRRLIVQAQANWNAGASFLVDSGSSETILDETFAQGIGVLAQYENPIMATDVAGNKVKFHWGILGELNVGNMKYKNISVLLYDFSKIRANMGIEGKFGGILSPQKLFHGLIYTVDYRNKNLQVSKKASLSSLESFHSAKMYKIEGDPYIAGQINNSPKIALLVDSGSKVKAV
jgi:tetratricopeptide (TPR) repeat protein